MLQYMQSMFRALQNYGSRKMTSFDKVHMIFLKETTQKPTARAILPSLNTAFPIWMSLYCVHK